MQEAIVTDGLWRKSLSAVRSLGKAGFDVSVFGDSLFTTSYWSAFTTRRLRSVLAKDEAQQFGEALLAYLKSRFTGERPVLLPMEDETLEWVSAHRDVLAQYADFLLPSAQALAVAQSKAATSALGARLALPTPETLIPGTVDEFVERLRELTTASKVTRYIAKPVSGSGSAGIVYLDAAKLPDWRAHWDKYGALIIQQRIDPSGQGLGVSLLFDSVGDCVASFAHARLQQYPNSGGPSTSRTSIVNDTLVERSIRLMKALDWRGVAMVEWKVDPVSNTPYLMEINPRFWGSLELAVRAGVDFPLLYARAARREKFDPVHNYRAAVVCRWLLPGELLRYLSQDSLKRESLRQFLRGLPQLAEEWDPKDIRGFLSSVVCPAVTILNPNYWKYLNR